MGKERIIELDHIDEHNRNLGYCKQSLSRIILKILPYLEEAFYWYLEGEDNSWRIKRNWLSYKKTLEEKYAKTKTINKKKIR